MPLPKGDGLFRRGVLAVHAEQVAEHGGAAGLRDRALPESALARPRQLAAHGDAPSVFRLAAYAYGIMRCGGARTVGSNPAG